MLFNIFFTNIHIRPRSKTGLRNSQSPHHKTIISISTIQGRIHKKKSLHCRK